MTLLIRGVAVSHGPLNQAPSSKAARRIQPPTVVREWTTGTTEQIGRLREELVHRIHVTEIIGPYAVAELKLEQALEAHRANARDEDFRLYIADTLDDPNKVPLPARGRCMHL
jgi:hypothetical protein